MKYENEFKRKISLQFDRVIGFIKFFMILYESGTYACLV